MNVKYDILIIISIFIAIGFFGSQWGPWHTGNDWGVETFYYLAWVASPYIIALLAIHFLNLSKRGKNIISSVSVICVILGSIFLYSNTVVHTDAMAGMLFLVVPIFQVFSVVVSIVASKVVTVIQQERNI